MKKLLVDIYLAHNLGDDMFLDFLSKKFPNTEITVYHPGSNYDSFIANYNNLNKLPYTFFDKILRRIRIYNRLNDYNRLAKEYDILLFLGGGIFREEPYWEELYKYRNQIVNSFNFHKKPIYILGSNFSNFKTKLFRDKYYNLFKKCTDVCFRDSYSYNIFKSLKNIRLAPDILWDYPISYNITKANKTIGFSLINPSHKHLLKKYKNQYVDVTVETVMNALKDNYKVKLFSFCEIEGDLNIINLIMNKISIDYHNQIEIIEYKNRIDDILQEISSLNIFIASRFHAVLLGLRLNINTIPISYNIKTTNLLNDINFKGKIINFDSLDELKKIDLQNLKTRYDSPSTMEKHFDRLNNNCD